MDYRVFVYIVSRYKVKASFCTGGRIPTIETNQTEVIGSAERGANMIGMGFAPFITLLILGLVAALVIHVLARYYVLAGFDGFTCAWIAAWIGGWLGTPVFGHWSIRSGSVYFIPAALGAFTGAFVVTAALKALAVAVGSRQSGFGAQSGAAAQPAMRKAS
jgi:uncharacterized membrane protein YeaQ/YmgE (transglycosylase-associated protein family)